MQPAAPGGAFRIVQPGEQLQIAWHKRAIQHQRSAFLHVFEKRPFRELRFTRNAHIAGYYYHRLAKRAVEVASDQQRNAHCLGQVGDRETFFLRALKPKGRS